MKRGVWLSWPEGGPERQGGRVRTLAGLKLRRGTGWGKGGGSRKWLAHGKATLQKQPAKLPAPAKRWDSKRVLWWWMEMDVIWCW